MSVINTNITSLIAQGNLSRSQSALQTSMERLSSGLRINSAKDDAAGQAIANRMTAQITGLAQAQRNANDGISIAQTAEGSLNQVNDNLQRIRELTVQAANGTNSTEDLQSIQDEIDQRLSEIDRISKETNFNGVDVLANDRGLTIQVGANDHQTITVNLQEINRGTLGLGEFDVTEAFTAAIQNVSRVPVEGAASDGTPIDTGGIDTTALGTDATVESVGQDENGNWFALVSGSDDSDDDGYYSISAPAADGTFTESLTSGDAEATDPTGYNAVTSVPAEGTPATPIDTGGIDTTALGTSATVESVGQDENGNWFALVSGSDDSDDDGYYSISAPAADGTFTESLTSGDAEATDPTGYNAVTDMGDGTEAPAGGSSSGYVAVDYSDLTPAGAAEGGEVSRLVKDEAGNYYVQVVGADSDDANGFYAATVAADGTVSVADWSATATIEGAPTGANLEPLQALDDALMQVDQLRSELGAVQNRFEDAITNLNTNETNLAAARSRIEDADYAVEVANMTRAQILQQAGTSVLAQANQIPQIALSLLG